MTGAAFIFSLTLMFEYDFVTLFLYCCKCIFYLFSPHDEKCIKALSENCDDPILPSLPIDIVHISEVSCQLNVGSVRQSLFYADFSFG